MADIEPKRSSTMWRYALGVIAVVIAIALHDYRTIPNYSLGLLYYFPIVLAAAYLGLVPGLLTAVVATLLRSGLAPRGLEHHFITWADLHSDTFVADFLGHLIAYCFVGLAIGLISRQESRIRRLSQEKARAEHLAGIGTAASFIVHEVKNPLSIILGYAHTLRQDYADLREKLTNPHSSEVAQELERQEQYLEIITAEIHRLDTITSSILDYVRKGGVQLDPQPGDLNQLLSEVCDLLAPTARDTGVELEDDLAYELPSIWFDREKLQQALLNLATNSIQAMSEGGTLKLSSSFDGIAQTVAIEVSDTGPGIPKQIRKNLFEPYATYGKSRGSGLGLAITKQIIEKHGGQITFTSNLGKGTTFTIILPALTSAS